MIKTQVQLEDWQYEAARRRANQLSRSMSDLVREGLTLVLRRLEKAPAGDLESIAGKYEPRETSDLKDHDRWFVESIR
jgi:hypothetical protein